MTILRTHLTTDDTENVEKGIEAKHVSPINAAGIVLKMPTDSLKNSDTPKCIKSHALRRETHR